MCSQRDFWVNSALLQSANLILIRVMQAAKKSQTDAKENTDPVSFALVLNYAIYSSAVQRSRDELNCNDPSTKKLCSNLSSHTRV